MVETSPILIPTPVSGDPSGQIVFYTQFELYKIWFSGALLAIAVIILTFIVYRWQRNRYLRWMYEQDVAEARAAGKNIASIPVPKYQKVVNKPLIVEFGAFVLVAGIVQFVI